MKVGKCSNCGKFFDLDTYEICPHCKTGLTGGDTKTNGSSKTGLFVRTEAKKKTETSYRPPVQDDESHTIDIFSVKLDAKEKEESAENDQKVETQPEQTPEKKPEKKLSPFERMKQRKAERNRENEKKDSRVEVTGNTELDDKKDYASDKQSSTDVTVDTKLSQETKKETKKPETQQTVVKNEDENQYTTSSTTLERMMNNASANTEGKTMGIYERVTSRMAAKEEKEEEPEDEDSYDFSDDDYSKTVGVYERATSRTIVKEEKKKESSDPYTRHAPEDDYNRTVGVYERRPGNKRVVERNAEPVKSYSRPAVESVKFGVGWLVCVAGPDLGSSYTIVDGQNSIGRNETNTIAIKSDGSVSRERHAWIIYDPNSRAFYLRSGDGRGITYLNNSIILEPKQLKQGDIITVGESKLYFVPLCNESFSWDEYVKGDK